jgi:hypothetical protein
MEKMNRARKGSGRVYQPKYRKAGELLLGTWRVRYVWRGKRYDEKLPDGWPNTKTGAQKFLKKRFGEQANGEFSAASGARELTYEQLRELLFTHYELNGLRSLKVARDKKTRYVNGEQHLARHFKGRRALDITTGAVEQFTIARRRDGASNASISVSLRILSRMFSLAVEAKKIARNDVPTIQLPQEPPARKGFLEPKDFPKLHAAMPEDLRPVLMLGFDHGHEAGRSSKPALEERGPSCGGDSSQRRGNEDKSGAHDPARETARRPAFSAREESGRRVRFRRRRTAREFSQAMAQCVRRGRVRALRVRRMLAAVGEEARLREAGAQVRRPDVPRPAAVSRPQPRARRNSAERRHEDHRTQDARSVQQVRHHGHEGRSRGDGTHECLRDRGNTGENRASGGRERGCRKVFNSINAKQIISPREQFRALRTYACQ